jgi:hypothetical protein
MCEPSPRSRGPLLWLVHSGLATEIGRRAHRCVARSCYGGRELTAETPRERGDRGEPHHDIGRRRGGAIWPGDGGPRWRQKFLDGAAFGARRMGDGGGIGCSGEMGCSWALYIGRGRLAGAAEERSRWRPVEFNGAVVLSLESAPRGRGNGGAALLWKWKRRRRGLGRGGGARRNGSRPHGRWRRSIGPDEGDEGGAGRVGCKGRVGRMTGWAGFGNGKRK